jgi:hypothetical protein
VEKGPRAQWFGLGQGTRPCEAEHGTRGPHAGWSLPAHGSSVEAATRLAVACAQGDGDLGRAVSRTAPAGTPLCTARR